MDDPRRTLADGRYELGEVLGRGGMGSVYRARDTVLGRAVAIKVLTGLDDEHDPVTVARFEREARAAAALSSPGVVAVYDTGTDDDARYIVMELVAGRSLAAILRDGPLEPERAVAIAAGVAQALDAAHAAGIVHRDIKPANVMVADDGSVKVLDFGIARTSGATTLTQNLSVVGTAAYMAPERALAHPADERSDIYSLGCLLYALLAGSPPFHGDTPAVILQQQANAEPDPLRAANDRVSPALDALVMQMLAKDPSDRPASAAEVRDRLATLPDAGARTAATTPLVPAATERLPTAATNPLAAAAGGAAAGGAAAGGAGAGGAAAARAAAGELPFRRYRDPRRLWIAYGVAALVAAILLIVLLSGGGSGSPGTSSTGRASRRTAPPTSTTRPPATSTPTTPATPTTTPAPATPTTPGTPPGPGHGRKHDKGKAHDKGKPPGKG